MNWNRIESNWKQSKGAIKAQWGKLTDDQLNVIAGKRNHLLALLQETYGISKHAAEWQLSGWENRQNVMPA